MAAGTQAIDAPRRGLDEVDRERIRAAATAVAAFVGAGLGAVLGISYVERCPCGASDALPLVGIAPSWAAAGAVALGRWMWTRGFGAGVAACLLLAWLAAHFVFRGLLSLYPDDEVVAAAGWTVGFLGYWSLVTAIMVAAVLGAAWLAERATRA